MKAVMICGKRYRITFLNDEEVILKEVKFLICVNEKGKYFNGKNQSNWRRSLQGW